MSLANYRPILRDVGLVAPWSVYVPFCFRFPLKGKISSMSRKEGTVPPSAEAASEALKLSEEILRNLELAEIPLTNIALKTSRLARLLNDFDIEKIMYLEAAGYPVEGGLLTAENWRLAVDAGRRYIDKDGTERAFIESID